MVKIRSTKEFRGGGNSTGFIKSKIEYNVQVNSKTYEESKLKKYFPQYFDKSGKFNFEKFKFALDEENVQYSDEEFSQRESYSLNFVGKKFAQIQCGQEPVTVITPDLEHNNQPENENSENIYIKGDNLEALKHMLNSYEGKIKCIYIDPPYNTNSDNFVYPDNFKYDKNTLMKMGLTEDEAERVENIYGKSTHSAWLTFMLPRLTLARDLLSDDGVIFISIDDNEQANLKELCDEIYGEENFVTNIIWQKKFSPQNDATYFSKMHDFIVCYAKKKKENKLDSGWNRILLPRDKMPNSYQNPDNDPRGFWSSGDFTAEGPSPNCIYEIIAPNGKKWLPPAGKRWVYSKDNFDRLYQEKRFWFGKDGSSVPRIKRYWNEVQQGMVPNSIWFFDEVGHTQEGKQETNALFGKAVFDYPKPERLLKRIILLSTQDSDVILDFFSGSATTAQAVMQLNAEDGGNRKFILVNIPEKLTPENQSQKIAYEAGFRTICDIGIERIKRAAKKIKEETNAVIDYGFKIYELNNLSEKTLDKIETFDEANSRLFADDIRNSFEFSGISGADTILQTWKVDDGYGFTAKHEEIYLNDCLAYKIKKSLYLINPTMTDFVKPLTEKLENELKEVNKIVALGYSYTLTQIQSLDINIKNFNDIKGQDDRVKVEVRY